MRSREFLFGIMTFYLVHLTMACGNDETGRDDNSHQRTSVETPAAPEVSVPDGTYQILGPACSSTGRSPIYEELNQSVSMLDFDYLVIRTKTIAADTWTEIYQDDDCSLTITGKIAINSGGIYQQTKERIHQWKPLSCRFEASYTPPSQAAG